jgi:HSP20 family protein
MPSGVPLTRDLDRFFQDFWSPTGSGSFVPAADVVENEAHYLLHLDLPGLRREDIKVNVENGYLEISGSRNQADNDEKDTVVRRERFRGEFTRRFRLGDRVVAGGIEAKYEDGVLEVKVPKVEEARPQQIEVK